MSTSMFRQGPSATMVADGHGDIIVEMGPCPLVEQEDLKMSHTANISIDNKVPVDLPRIIAAEFVGSILLAATLVGSGIMGDTLSGGGGKLVTLLVHTLATWGIFFVLITIFGPVSGAHFNPVVSLTFFLRKEIMWAQLVLGVIAQYVGCILGVFLAHGMYQVDAASFDGPNRTSPGQFVSEIVATFGLLITILGCVEGKAKQHLPMAVGLYFTAAFLFTKSNAFANPAVTVARSFTSTFAGIAPKSTGPYLGGQAVGTIVGIVFCQWIFAKKSFLDALKTLIRK